MSEALKAKMSRGVLIQKEPVGAPELAIFKFKTDGEVFPFKPGQYATLGLDVTGKFIPRPYSIASAPFEQDILEFYIIMVDGGTFTPLLFQLKLNDTIYYMGPKGRFTLNRTNAQYLVFVATGTGLAPFISMLRQMIKEKEEGKPRDEVITLMHGVRLSQDLGYKKELEMIEKEKKLNFAYVPTVSRPQKDSNWTSVFGQGRVNDVLRKFMGEPKSATVDPEFPEGITSEFLSGRMPPGKTSFLICGNPEMGKDIKAFAPAHGYNEIYTEDYW